MDRVKRVIYFSLAFTFFCGSFFVYSGFILADEAEIDHLVISEIQISGDTVYDEFVELYNPTDLEVNLEGWDLKRKTKSGNESNMLYNIQGVIPAHGYFLIVPRVNCGKSQTEVCYGGAVVADDEYTTNSFLAKNNTVLLYDNGGNLVDKVGWGEATDFEKNVLDNIAANQSWERKITAAAIQDTDNNGDDFLIQTNPNPQNSDFVAGEIGTADDDSNQGDANNENNGNGGNQNNYKEVDNDSKNNSSQNSSQNGQSNDDIEIDNIEQDGLSSQDNEDNSGTETGEQGVNVSSRPNSYIPPEIIITEFLPNPEDSDRDNEFIEIYNGDSGEVDLGGWTLEDKKGRIKKFIISERERIKPKKYKVFYSDETRITLNNSGDGLTLKDERGNIIYETPISDSAGEEQSFVLGENGKWVWTLRPTPGRKNIIKTEEKKKENENKDVNKKQVGFAQENGSDESEDNHPIQNGELNQNNIILNENNKNNKSEQYDFSDNIIISEIYPNPKGRDNRNNNYEWIELYNDSDRDVNLKDWQIDDILKKGSKPYFIKQDTIIKAREYKVFSSGDTKLTLNNSGDEINILWPDGTVVDSVKYEKSVEGQTYSFSNDGSWAWSFKTTSGKKNIVETEMASKEKKPEGQGDRYLENENIDGEKDEQETEKYKTTDSADYIEITVDQAKKLPRYTQVKVVGIVSTSPGIFSDRIFYISGSGIQIYVSGVEIPRINIGDEVEIVGRISEIGGEKRILLDGLENIRIISHDNLIEPKIVSTGSIGKPVEGYLVTVEGKITRARDDVFFVDDGSKEAKIYVKLQTGIKKPKIQEGDWAVITGQVSRTSAGYRILPRFQSDIKLGKVSGVSIAEASLTDDKSNEKNNKFIFYILLVAITVLVLIGWRKLRRLKSKKFKLKV